MSVVFTLGVIANFVALALQKYANWIGILAGLPLALLWLTGMYLFVLPYAARRRGGPGTDP